MFLWSTQIIIWFLSFISYSDELECGTGNGGCEQNCVNTLGSYICSCNMGYTLISDGHNCDSENNYNIIFTFY